MAWRDYADVTFTAEKISRGLKAFADSLLECLKIQSDDILPMSDAISKTCVLL